MSRRDALVPARRGSFSATLRALFALACATVAAGLGLAVAQGADGLGSVEPRVLALLVGEQASLAVDVGPTGDAPGGVRWTVVDGAVAEVDPTSGMITALTPGTTEVRASGVTDGRTLGTTSVTVVDRPSVIAVDITADRRVIQVGSSFALDARVVAAGDVDRNVRVFSDDAAVVAVGSDGTTLSAVGNGTAVITAVSLASPAITASIVVTVTDQPIAAFASVSARVVPGSLVEVAWDASNADAVEIGCAGPGEPILERLPGDRVATTIPIPAASCQVLQLRAEGRGADAVAEVRLRDVVFTGDDAPTGHDPLPGSLRAVVASAEPGAVIGFASDVREVILVGKAYAGTNDAHLVLDRDITLSAPRERRVTLRSDPSLATDREGVAVQRTRLLYVPRDADVRLEHLVLRGGTFTSSGGAVRNDGALTIVDSLLEDNRAFYRGGAIHNLGTLVVLDSVLRANRAIVTDAELDLGFACIDALDRSCRPGDINWLEFGRGGSGGAIYHEAGSAQIERSVIVGNVGAYSGGGVYVEAGTVELVDSDVVENVASDAGLGFETYSFGGGIANFSADGVQVTGGAIRGNSSGNVGGGLANGSSQRPDLPLTLDGVLVVENRAGEFGGGLIHYFVEDRGALVEVGATDVLDNVAGDALGGEDGDDRSYSGPR